MKAFTRTASGIGNYSAFYGAQLLIYTEGKVCDENLESPLDDQIFYGALLRHILPGVEVKVKCVGNRQSALQYARKIVEGGARGSVVCIDRDFGGLCHSMLPLKCLVQTNGYSWENDLWTVRTSERVLSRLCNSEVNALHARVRSLVRRLRLLSILDASLQPHGIALLNKNAEQGGISFKFGSLHPISKLEIRRLVDKYKSSPAMQCAVSHGVMTLAVTTPSSRLIQGHIWSNAMRGLIGHLYKVSSKDKVAPSKRMLLNLAFNELRDNPLVLLGEVAVEHYKKAFEAAMA